jgi:hypothetical protein
MKKLLKIIPNETMSIDELKLPLSKSTFIDFKKQNLFLKGSLKDLNKFIIQSLIYISLSYDLNEFDIVLIDFNEGNKALYKLSSLDTIKYIFLEPEAVNLSISLDELNQDKKTLFFIFERENMDSLQDFELLIQEDINNLSKNKNFRVITLYEGEKKNSTVSTSSFELKKTKFALEKEFIPDFILKINQDINTSINNVMNYRRSKVAYLKNTRLF